MKIEFSKVEKDSPTMHCVSVKVDGMVIGELIKDPTAELAEWYSRDDEEFTNAAGDTVALADMDFGRTLSEAKREVRAWIKEYAADARARQTA